MRKQTERRYLAILVIASTCLGEKLKLKMKHFLISRGGTVHHVRHEGFSSEQLGQVGTIPTSLRTRETVGVLLAGEEKRRLCHIHCIRTRFGQRGSLGAARAATTG